MAKTPPQQRLTRDSAHLNDARIIEIARLGAPMSDDEKKHFDTCQECRSNIALHILGAQHAAHTDHAHQKHKNIVTEVHLVDWWVKDLPKDEILEIDTILKSCSICREVAEREGRALELLGEHLDWERLRPK